jgi:hypothetical protein
MARGPCRVGAANFDHLNGEVIGHPHAYSEDHGLEEEVLDNQDDPEAVIGSQDGPEVGRENLGDPEVVLDSREAVEVLACLVVVVPVDLDVEVFGDLEADRGSRGDLERVLCDDLEQGLGSLDDLEVDCGSLDDLEVDHRGSQKVVHDYLGG